METPNTYNTLGTVKEQISAIRSAKRPKVRHVAIVDESENDRRHYFTAVIGCGMFGLTVNFTLHLN